MAEIRQKGKRFIYRTNLSWKEEKKGLLTSSDRPAIEVSTPFEFKGHAGIWTPEELFVSSVNICIMTTFLYYAGKEAIKLLSYQSECEGILERIDKGFIFSEIIVKPRILIKEDNNIQKARELMELSEKKCLISNSIKTKIKVIPEIKIGN